MAIWCQVIQFRFNLFKHDTSLIPCDLNMMHHQHNLYQQPRHMMYHTHHLIQYNHHFIQCKNNLIHYHRSRINNDLNLIQHYIFQIRIPESTAAQPAQKKAVKFIVDEPSDVSQKPAILASQSSSIPKESHVHNGDSKIVMSKNDTSAVLAADVGDGEHFVARWH